MLSDGQRVPGKKFHDGSVENRDYRKAIFKLRTWCFAIPLRRLRTVLRSAAFSPVVPWAWSLANREGTRWKAQKKNKRETEKDEKEKRRRKV